MFYSTLPNGSSDNERRAKNGKNYILKRFN